MRWPSRCAPSRSIRRSSIPPPRRRSGCRRSSPSTRRRTSSTPSSATRARRRTRPPAEADPRLLEAARQAREDEGAVTHLRVITAVSIATTSLTGLAEPCTEPSTCRCPDSSTCRVRIRTGSGKSPEEYGAWLSRRDERTIEREGAGHDRGDLRRTGRGGGRRDRAARRLLVGAPRAVSRKRDPVRSRDEVITGFGRGSARGSRRCCGISSRT